jgi:hypothetical protein
MTILDVPFMKTLGKKLVAVLESVEAIPQPERARPSK